MPSSTSPRSQSSGAAARTTRLTAARFASALDRRAEAPQIVALGDADDRLAQIAAVTAQTRLAPFGSEARQDRPRRPHAPGLEPGQRILVPRHHALRVGIEMFGERQGPAATLGAEQRHHHITRDFGGCTIGDDQPHLRTITPPTGCYKARRGRSGEQLGRPRRRRIDASGCASEARRRDAGGDEVRRQQRGRSRSGAPRGAPSWSNAFARPSRWWSSFPRWEKRPTGLVEQARQLCDDTVPARDGHAAHHWRADLDGAALARHPRSRPRVRDLTHGLASVGSSPTISTDVPASWRCVRFGSSTSSRPATW